MFSTLTIQTFANIYEIIEILITIAKVHNQTAKENKKKYRRLKKIKPELHKVF